MNRSILLNATEFSKNLQSFEKQLRREAENRSRKLLIKQMGKLIDQFQSIQAMLSPSLRYRLRERFLQLSIQGFESLREMAITLANTTYTLSRSHADLHLRNGSEQWTNKSKTSAHRVLERGLQQNQRTILEMMKIKKKSVDHLVTIQWLRDEAKRLIRELNEEIKCEQKMLRCNRTRPCKFRFWGSFIH